MTLPKRLTKPRKLIARVDPALANVDFKTLGEYFRTLDIETLGDLTSLQPKPTIFTVQPLKTNYSSLDKGLDKDGKDLCTADDLWAIFATHVFECDDKSVDFSTEGDGKYKHLKDEVREQFFETYITDIANMIRQLANGDGNTVPFAPPVGIAEKIFNQRMQCARSRVPNVPLEDAKAND